MSEADCSGGGDNKKRSSQFYQPKKKGKLSSIVMRALLAMESDDDDSNSSNSENEKNVRDFQREEDEDLGGQISATQKNLSAAGAQSAYRQTRMMQLNSSGDFGAVLDTAEDKKDRENSRSHNFQLGSNSTESKDKNRDSQQKQNRQILDAEQSILKINRKGDVGVVTNTKFDEERRDSSPVVEENDHICPHEVGVDILSSFWSTPFDDKAMLTLLKSKSIAHGTHLTHTRTQHVPIISQREFGKKQKGRVKQMNSPQNASDDISNPTEAASIRAEVCSFLLLEGQHLINSLPSHHDAHTTTSKQQLRTFQNPLDQSVQQPLQQPLNHRPHLLSNQQLQQSKYCGRTQAQYSSYQVPLHSYASFQQMQHGYQLNNVRQFPQHFPAHAAFALVPNLQNSYNTHTFTPTPSPSAIPPAAMDYPSAVSQRISTSLPRPKVVTASAKIELTDSNRNDIAKLPVAFGYLLDKTQSTILAKCAAKKWVQEGRFAAKSESYKQGRKSHKPRRNPTTPPSQPAGPEFPDGWTTKTFARRGSTPGKSGSYTTFYSPVTMRTFRSKKGALTFIKILNEPGIKADEKLAFDVFKRRGYKV